MSDDKKYIILEDKFVDILMHTATRNDIAEIRREMHDTHAATGNAIAELRKEMNAIDAKHEAKLDNIVKDVRSEIKDVRSEINRKFYWLLGLFLPLMFGGFGSLWYQINTLASKIK